MKKGLDINRFTIILAVIIFLSLSLSVNSVWSQCTCDNVPEDIVEEVFKLDPAAKVDKTKLLQSCLNDLDKLINAARANDSNKCSDSKIALKDKIKRKIKYLADDISRNQKVILNPQSSVTDLKDASEKLANLRPTLINFQTMLNIPSYPPLYLRAEDYDNFFAKFNFGYEYTAVNKLFNQGNARVGFLMSTRFWAPRIETTGLSRQGLYTSFSVGITNSAEQATSASDQATDKSLKFDYSVFWPWGRTAELTKDHINMYIGPIINIGANKTDSVSRADHKLYGGFRFQINPDMYADIMYGETKSLSTKRLEVRGQIPVHRFENGTRIFLGAIGNFGLTTTKDGGSGEDDVTTAYLSWDVDFKDVYKYFSGKDL